jgi:hypothetical protein
MDRPTTGIIPALLLLSMLLAGGATAATSQPDNNHAAALLEQLVPYKMITMLGDDVTSETLLGYTVPFATHQPRLPLEELPGAMALERAATYYAMATLDFDVTYGELVAHGYWPFDTYGAENHDCGIYDFPAGAMVLTTDYSDHWKLDDIGSSWWLARCREDILDSFYFEYYFGSGGIGLDEDNIPPAAYPPGPMTEAFWYDGLFSTPDAGDSTAPGSVQLGEIDRFRDNFHTYADPEISRIGLDVHMIILNWDVEPESNNIAEDPARPQYDTRYREPTRVAPEYQG